MVPTNTAVAPEQAFAEAWRVASRQGIVKGQTGFPAIQPASYQPPVTGGKKATSSPVFTSVSTVA